jgi:hypothetical protein
MSRYLPQAATIVLWQGLLEEVDGVPFFST